MVKDVGPIYGVELIETLRIKGAMLQSMPSVRDLNRVAEVSIRTAAGYEVLLSKYTKLITACKAVQAAVEKHCAETGDVIWIRPPYQAEAVHESVGDRLFAVLEDSAEVP